MKRIIYPSLLLLISVMASCELDNYDGPDASVYGALIDEATNENVQQEFGFSGEAVSIQVIRKGMALSNPQNWKVMLNGEYRNNLVFSGTFDIVLNNGNFIPLDTIRNFKFEPGENKLDFSIVPNIRIKNPKIEKVDETIVATFNMEYGHPQGKVQNIALFSQSDQNPSSSFYLTRVSTDVSDQDLDHANNSTYENETFSIVMDLNSGEGAKLASGRSYFFRIGALPTNLGQGIQARYNYSPVIEIDIP